MTISVIIGSTRQGRFSEKPAQWILQQLRKRDTIEPRALDLRDFPMPFFDQPLPPAMPGRSPYEHDLVKKWTAQIQASEGFVFVTPEYNYSPSAVQWNHKSAAFASCGQRHGCPRRPSSFKWHRSDHLFPFPWRRWAHFQGGDVEKGLAELEKQANVIIDELLWWTAVLMTASER